MPAVGPAPRWWFWSHDIQPDQISDLTMPGMRLRRQARPNTNSDKVDISRREFTLPFWMPMPGERARGTGWSVHVDVDADAVA